MPGNPYLAWVERFASALADAAAIGPAPVQRGADPSDRPKALIFAPHPDDEVIVGALPLRLLRECGYAVVNVAVTLGSRRDRRPERWRELEAACAALGFGLVTPDHNGLEGISPDGRAQDEQRWLAAVAATAAVLDAEQPQIVFLPHQADWNQTHVGVHQLVVAAMSSLPNLRCQTVETEFWGAMVAPNLMVESTTADVADLVAALSLHVGEVARNPYHLRLPAWMMDNVRRGAELVGGQGGSAPGFAFATLYRLRAWRQGGFSDVIERGCVVSAADDLKTLFPIA